MMGERRVMQEALFYGFSLERHVPSDHMLRSIDRFVDLSGVRARLEPYYSAMGRPSIDPELMIRMLLVGYCLGVRSERRLCEEVHLNLAYRWFCRLGLDSEVPDHSTFSKNRHGRFRDSDLLRQVFETVVARCMAEGLVGGEGFAVDASVIAADAHRQRGVTGTGDLAPISKRAVTEYLAVLNDAAFGGATLVDLKHAVIMDVEATTAVRQAEVTAAKTMITRTADRFDTRPTRLAADTGYGSAEMLAWLVDERGIEPHIPVFDKSGRTDGTFSRDAFNYDRVADVYVCPGDKTMTTTGTLVNDEATLIYRASKYDCDACDLKPRCCPNTPARKVPRSIHEAARDRARDIAKTDAYVTSRRERKKVEMLFAHLKRILKLDRLRLRGPNGARDEFHLAATAQNLRKLAKLIPMPAPVIA